MSAIQFILKEIDKPFNYSLTFHGSAAYSEDGQLWGVNSITITKSKTTITLSLKKTDDVREFKTFSFIRSIDELKEKLQSFPEKSFFNEFNAVHIYRF